jgi:3-hydroxybutyryl-CoA dehydrogenase
MVAASIGIIGAGTMGAGIAQVALEAGHEVRLHDPDPRAFARASDRVREGLTRRAGTQGVDTAAAGDWIEGHLARLRPAPDVAAVAAAADLVIEAAPEDLEIKGGVFRDLDAAARPEAVLATNTSALSVASIAAGTRRPARVLGLHFFNPAPVMPLVEVVATPATDPGVVARMRALMESWGKTAVRCADAPGFIVNRVHRPFTLEALAIVFDAGATIVRVDRLLRAAGFPMGPFELMDLVGLDVNLAAASAIYRAEWDDGRGGTLAERFRPSPIQERMVAAGHLGRKMSGGFYRYEGTGPPLGPARLWDLPEDPVRAVDDDEIVERIVLAIANEAYRAAGAGIAAEADIDLALRLGAGHPVGPFGRVHEMGGPAATLSMLRRYAAAGPRFSPAPALLAAAGEG